MTQLPSKSDAPKRGEDDPIFMSRSRRAGVGMGVDAPIVGGLDTGWGGGLWGFAGCRYGWSPLLSARM